VKNIAASFLVRMGNFITQKSLVSRGDKILAAVSGGADSMCLLHALLSLREERGFAVEAAHFDHRLRGAESAAEGDLVEAACRKWGVPCHRGGAEEAFPPKGNVQEWAREARFAFLRETARRSGAVLIAAAHHRDDQAETVLLHLLRGGGTEGLAAMSAKERGVIRPLLWASREEIEEYCREMELEFCQDPSNLSVKYLRNRLRLQLLPLLREYNPCISAALAQTAEICGEENDLLNSLAEAAWSETRLEGGLSGAALERLPQALKRRVLRLAFAFRGGRELTFGQTEAVLALKEGGAQALPGGLWAFRQGGDWFFADRLPEEAESAPFSLPVEPGKHSLPGGWEYEAEIVSAAGPPGRDTLFLPAGLLPELKWRSRREGDFLRQPGIEGRKSLKKLFIDEKIPREERGAWPLLFCLEEMLWVPLLRRGLYEEPARGAEVLVLRCRKKV